MGSFLADNVTYNITTENQLAVILSHFNTDYIFDVVQDNINNRFKFYQVNMPNAVQSLDNYFKQIFSAYPSEKDKINDVREKTYLEIIQIMCNKFNLTFNYQTVEDYLSPAYYLYSFLISDFSKNIVQFFSNYIIKEKNAIYDMLNLNDMKKSKDTSTLYNKKTYKNQKIAIINANLEYVIRNICAFDIDFATILNCVYLDKNKVKYIMNIVQPNMDFFKEQYLPFINNPNLSPIIITDIRLNIQKLCMNEDVSLQNF